jgi:hypothetical protein
MSRHRIAIAFERVLLGLGMSLVALVVERQLNKRLKRRQENPQISQMTQIYSFQPSVIS